jgi:CO/xanthine dehydrogenase FAD-binding subunit
VKPAPFEYVRATSVDEAIGALAGEDSKVLAGGQSLLPALNLRVLRPSLLVDVNRVAGLDDVEESGDALRVVVGAVTPYPSLLEVDPERPGESAAAQVEPWASVHASPAYLRQLVRVLVERAVARAREHAA